MEQHNSNPWRLWRKEERARMNFQKDLARIKNEITELEEAMFLDLVNKFRNDKSFIRALDRFTGHTPEGWRVAAQPDGRIAGLTRMGWETLSKLIKTVRRIRNGGY